MNRKNLVFFAVGILLAVVSVWQIAAAQGGLKVIHLAGNPPVTIITPAGAAPASRPTVLIAHGFAGSEVLMRGFALTLAHAGYTTVSWDFEGHGRNPRPLLPSSEGSDLLHDAEAALAEAETTGIIDSQRVAILGHSMGSGVALAYGVAHPETYATIAISPVSQTVTPSLPHNLLVMAGSLEPQFVARAGRLVATAGGQGGDFAEGTARQQVTINNVEHTSILFSPTTHKFALSWLNSAFGVQPGASKYVDHRILWFAVGIAGAIFLSAAAIGSIRPFQVQPSSISPLWLRLIALVGGGLLATLVLWLVSKAGINLSQLMGLLVGGYIILWFGVAGIIALLIYRPHIARPTAGELIKGLIAFIALWLGVGLLGNFVWIPWLLVPARLALWVPASILALPWFLAVGEAVRNSKPIAQAGWWLLQVIVMIGGLYLALVLSPSLGFIFLIMPVIPVMLGLQALAVSPRHGAWAYALPGAMFTAWLLLAVFPIQ